MTVRAHLYFHAVTGLGSPTALHSRRTSSLTAWMTWREKLATAAGTGLCGVSVTICDSGPRPFIVLAVTQKLNRDTRFKIQFCKLVTKNKVLYL